MDVALDWLQQLGEYWDVLSLTGLLIGVLHIPSVLLRRSNRPMATLSWVLGLLLFPFLGVILWWMIGRSHLERRRRQRSRAVETISGELSSMKEGLELREPAEKVGGSLSRRQAMLVQDNEVFPTTRGNHVRVLQGGTEAYDVLEEAIRAAESHVHLEFYIWQSDQSGIRFRDLLIEKAREGVEVRVLYDAVGGAKVHGRFMKPLRKAGGEVAPFLPVNLFERRLRINFRNHRKIVVVDGSVGFTGGVNIGDEYREWYDLAFEFHGPVVNQMQEVFAEDWYFATSNNLASERYFAEVNGAVPPGPGYATDVMARVASSGPDTDTDLIHAMYFMAITSAREKIYLTTPYFIPDASITMALRTAAMRGVDVRLLLPGKSDVPVARTAGRGYFEELLQAGVRIFEYQPEILHAKYLLFDDEITILGSANMDIRSFQLNFEANVAVQSEELNRQLSDQFLSRLEESKEIVLSEFSGRSDWERLRESTARLFSPLL